MATVESKSSESTIRITGGQRPSQGRTIAFGRVEVEAEPADPRAFAINVRAGQDVMERAVKRLSTAGVRFQKKRGVASYRADPKNPDQVIRDLMGKAEVGVFENGEFKVLE